MWGYRIEVLLVTVRGLKQRLQIVLLYFLANDLLQRLSLEDLICLLLGVQFNKQGLIDALKRCHFGMLSRVRRMRSRFELADVGFALSGGGANRSDGLQIARVDGV